MAVYKAVLQPGDTMLGMGLAFGGHLTQGYSINFSGKLLSSSSYGWTATPSESHDEC